MVCSLLLLSTLLAGCHQTGASGSSGATGASGSMSAVSASGPTTSTAAALPPGSTPAPTSKTADVSWSAPTTNTNGSALTDLAGYRIYYGTSPSQLTQKVDIPSAGATNYVVQGLTQGTWYFAVTSYTNTGLESGLSSVVSKSIS